MMRAAGLAAMILGAPIFLARPVAAQGIEGQVGRFYEGGGWDIYRLGVARPIAGVFGLGLHGNYLRRADGGDGGFAGVSADLTAFKGGDEGPYLVAGVGGGMGSPESRNFSQVWGSWSAGAGYELFPASFLAFGAEARWRELSLDRRDGLEVSAGLSIRFGRSSHPRPVPPASAPVQPVSDLPAASTGSAAGSPGAPEAESRTKVLREAVIATAKDAMGRPYSWGGTGANGGGFDCSGLIQHAYSQHGISLPRISTEQAKEGRAIAKKLGSLAPGDLLTFSNRGGPVSHVGLYVGEGRFIHSASRGVQISILSDADPYGRWWYKRWVGARRIIE